MKRKKINHKNQTKSQRQLQIGEQIKRVLAEVFLQDNLFLAAEFHLTILQADVSPDAKNAKIFISAFGEVDEKKIIAEIKKVTPYMRKKLSEKLNLRYTPELLFVLDKTSDALNKIEDLLKSEVKKFS